MSTIFVIGLGSGNPGDLSPTLLESVKQTGTLYVRTVDFPLIAEIAQLGIEIIGFDHIYETQGTFDEVYDEICRTLIAEAKAKGDIYYGVPGHPCVAERTVKKLIDLSQSEGINVKILGGHSFLDQVFTSFGFDPIEGFLLLDATDLKDVQLNPRMHTVIAQVYDRLVASDVKITLMDVYPDEMIVWFGSYLGTSQEQIGTMPLYELDHREDWNNFSLIYIPPVQDESVLYSQFLYMRDIVAKLRSPEGCPWDREQTHESIRKNLIEETYEVCEAIDTGDVEGLKEELGDLLLQIMLHSQMANEEGYFTISDVIYGINEKLIRRHPHVFAEKVARDANEALQNWQEMKNREKEAKGIQVQEQSVLNGIPKDLPAVLTAYKLQKKAASVGFDWDRLEDVLAKVEEEWQELRETHDPKEQAEELGDLLFAIVNLARHLGIDPEEALAKTNHKFKKRFFHIEQTLRESGKDVREASLEEMEHLWQSAKKI